MRGIRTGIVSEGIRDLGQGAYQALGELRDRLSDAQEIVVIGGEGGYVSPRSPRVTIGRDLATAIHNARVKARLLTNYRGYSRDKVVVLRDSLEAVYRIAQANHSVDVQGLCHNHLEEFYQGLQHVAEPWDFPEFSPAVSPSPDSLEDRSPSPHTPPATSGQFPMLFERSRTPLAMPRMQGHIAPFRRTGDVMPALLSPRGPRGEVVQYDQRFAVLRSALERAEKGKPIPQGKRKYAKCAILMGAVGVSVLALLCSGPGAAGLPILQNISSSSIAFSAISALHSSFAIHLYPALSAFGTRMPIIGRFLPDFSGILDHNFLILIRNM